VCSGRGPRGCVGRLGLLLLFGISPRTAQHRQETTELLRRQGRCAHQDAPPFAASAVRTAATEYNRVRLDGRNGSTPRVFIHAMKVRGVTPSSAAKNAGLWCVGDVVDNELSFQRLRGGGASLFRGGNGRESAVGICSVLILPNSTYDATLSPSWA
jgi:hypothetical protein